MSHLHIYDSSHRNVDFTLIKNYKNKHHSLPKVYSHFSQIVVQSFYAVGTGYAQYRERSYESQQWLTTKRSGKIQKDGRYIKGSLAATDAENWCIAIR